MNTDKYKASSMFSIGGRANSGFLPQHARYASGKIARGATDPDEPEAN
jgi:hypothetical protein